MSCNAFHSIETSSIPLISGMENNVDLDQMGFPSDRDLHTVLESGFMQF